VDLIEGSYRTPKVLKISRIEIRGGLVRTALGMEDKKYYELLEFLQSRDEEKGWKYIEWANQFEEIRGQIYKNNRRIVPRSQVLRLISIFHDLPTAGHQSKDTV